MISFSFLCRMINLSSASKPLRNQSKCYSFHVAQQIFVKNWDHKKFYKMILFKENYNVKCVTLSFSWRASGAPTVLLCRWTEDSCFFSVSCDPVSFSEPTSSCSWTLLPSPGAVNNQDVNHVTHVNLDSNFVVAVMMIMYIIYHYLEVND